MATRSQSPELLAEAPTHPAPHEREVDCHLPARHWSRRTRHTRILLGRLIAPHPTRRWTGRTQADVAAEAGLSVRVLQRAEQGRRRLSIGQAAVIAESLGRSLDELVKVWAEATFEPPQMGRPPRADRP